MLRDVVTSLVWAGLAFAYCALMMSLTPLQSADEASSLLVFLAGGFAAIVFLHLFTEARDDRRLRAIRAKTVEQTLRRGNGAGECAATERLPAGASWR
jgi:hypothetical protein